MLLPLNLGPEQFLPHPRGGNQKLFLRSRKSDQVLFSTIPDFQFFLELLRAEGVISNENICFSFPKNSFKQGGVWFQGLDFEDSAGKSFIELIRSIEVGADLQFGKSIAMPDHLESTGF